MRRFLTAAVTAAAGALISLPPLGEASAQEADDVRIEVRGADGDLADLGQIAPGEMRSGELTVVNLGALPIVLRASAVDVVEREDGCSGGEAAVDGSCLAGDGDGELGGLASFALVESTGSDTAVLFTGSIYDLIDVPLGDALAPGVERSLRLDYGLPSEASDVGQGDLLGFALEISYEQRGASVAGETVRRVRGATLPGTGGDLGELVGHALLATTAGWGLLLLARGRRRRVAPAPVEDVSVVGPAPRPR